LDSVNDVHLGFQARVLDRWADDSVRWLLVDFVADAEPDRQGSYVLRHIHSAEVTPKGELRISTTDEEVRLDTGRAVFTFAPGGSFPFARIDGDQVQPIDCERSGLSIDLNGDVLVFEIASARVLESGPLRASIEVLGRTPGRQRPRVSVCAQVEAFAGSAVLRAAVTIHNPQRARHPAGVWVLGDPGSIHIRSAVLRLHLRGVVQHVRCAAEFGTALDDVDCPFEIYQESSGGEQWQNPIHRNRDGIVPYRFRGYRLCSGNSERRGHRASPIVVLETSLGSLAVTMPQFWQNCPRAITVADSIAEIGLFPRQAAESYELQGGEQKTFVVVVAFGRDVISDPPLAWCHDPQWRYPSPEWCCATRAVPLLLPQSQDPNEQYLRLVGSAIDPVDGFFAKRERADEYGWRHFGDLHGDHESAFQAAGQPLVSHYNNQYDALACFALHFLRSGDDRWRELMVDLARHVRDIDIYYTSEDKAAYNGGLFWHTIHYADAGTSTHRTYPRDSSGGGPSSEHNYNLGLMLHYFMTGERASRDAAIGLGQWVIDMDDGSRTVFRLLATGATGLASASGSSAYHGPGRGSANSILACLVANRLTGNAAFAHKADELIRRCIHPDDDLEALNLFDVERRWYYTMFLQTLGLYLEQKADRSEFDGMFEYAKASLLHYARWMAEHEQPYLDHPERLEFPNETWAAQDMRKADVLLWATRHAAEDDRAFLFERAQHFFDYSVGLLSATPKHKLTRPIILILSNGFRYSWFLANRGWRVTPSTAATVDQPPPQRPFTSQRVQAMARAKRLGAVAVAAAAVIAALLLL
jgi:hypothetical protein